MKDDDLWNHACKKFYMHEFIADNFVCGGSSNGMCSHSHSPHIIEHKSASAAIVVVRPNYLQSNHSPAATCILDNILNKMCCYATRYICNQLHELSHGITDEILDAIKNSKILIITEFADFIPFNLLSNRSVLSFVYYKYEQIYAYWLSLGHIQIRAFEHSFSFWLEKRRTLYSHGNGI